MNPPYSIYRDPKMRLIAEKAKERGMGKEQFKSILKLHVDALRKQLKRPHSDDIFKRFFDTLANEINYQCWVLDNSF